MKSADILNTRAASSTCASRRKRLELMTAGLMAAAIAFGCSQESADRAANAIEKAPGQMERQAERGAAVLDDASITAKVKSALIAEPGVKGVAIDVDTHENVVTLKGTVPTESASKDAERIAREVKGVKEVKNDLLVQG